MFDVPCSVYFGRGKNNCACMVNYINQIDNVNVESWQEGH